MPDQITSAVEVDPVIAAVFGPAPDDVDLTQSQLKPNTAAAIIVTIIATVSVILRLLARNIQGFGITLDDWILIAALVFVFGTAGLAIAGCEYGAGRHIWSVTHTDLAMIFKLLFSYTYVYSASVSATKISLLLFYRRIFTRGTAWFHARLWFAMFLCVGYPITCWLYMALACKPASYFWRQFLGEEGSCGDTNSAFMALTVINMVNDIAVLCVPIPEILTLQMSNSRKAGVAGIMLLGSFVCIASIVRIVTYAAFMVTIDKTWEMGYFFLWSSLEPAVGVLCACLPTLRPLVSKVKGTVTGTSTNATGMGASAGGSKANWSRSGGKSFNTYTKFDDDGERGASEVGLTTIVKDGSRSISDDASSFPKEGILVKSDIHIS